MANRVLFGRRNVSSVGLYISKPGFDVLTASDGNLLFSSDFYAWQCIQSGALSVPNGSEVLVTHPNLGYFPAVVVSPNLDNPHGTWGLGILSYVDIQIRHVSNTQFNLYVSVGGFDYNGTLSYLIIRERADG